MAKTVRRISSRNSRRRELVAGGFAELGDRGEFGGIGDRELELAPFAADGGAGAVGFDAERVVAALAEDRTELVDGQQHRAGRVDVDAGHFVADADFEVGGHQRGALCR